MRKLRNNPHQRSAQALSKVAAIFTLGITGIVVCEPPDYGLAAGHYEVHTDKPNVPIGVNVPMQRQSMIGGTNNVLSNPQLAQPPVDTSQFLAQMDSANAAQAAAGSAGAGAEGSAMGSSSALTTGWGQMAFISRESVSGVSMPQVSSYVSKSYAVRGLMDKLLNTNTAWYLPERKATLLASVNDIATADAAKKTNTLTRRVLHSLKDVATAVIKRSDADDKSSEKQFLGDSIVEAHNLWATYVSQLPKDVKKNPPKHLLVLNKYVEDLSGCLLLLKQ